MAEMIDEKWLAPERTAELKETLYEMALRNDGTLKGRDIGFSALVPIRQQRILP